MAQHELGIFLVFVNWQDLTYEEDDIVNCPFYRD